MEKLRKLARDTRGASAIEYGLLAALIAIGAIAAMGSVGNSTKAQFKAANAALWDGR